MTPVGALRRTESFTFDGVEIPFVPGQSIAAALLGAGQRVTRRTRIGTQPRGLFCGIGVCFDCLVTVNGRPNIRSCLEPARAGGLVETQEGTGERQRAIPGADSTRVKDPAGGHAATGPSKPRPTLRQMIDAEVVVVGAGPAGLAAAVAAADSGAEVVVVDAGHAPGGQYLRQPAVDAPSLPARHGAASVALARSGAHPRVQFLPRHHVWAAGLDDARPVLYLRDPAADAAVKVRARALVLAPGAHDRTVPFPGWDLPGVMTAGAAQALIKGQGVLAGRRLLVAGTGPFLLVVAAGLAEAGADVAAVVEANRPARWLRHPAAVVSAFGKFRDAAHYAAVLRRHRVPVLTGHAVTEVAVDRYGLRATIERVNPAWQVVAGGRRNVHADAICVGFGFTPSVELAANLGCELAVDPRDRSVVVTVDGLQRTGVRAVLAAGEITGVGGAERAAWQGTVAGLAAALSTGHLTEQDCLRGSAPAQRHIVREERFATAMHAVYAVRPGWLGWLRPETVLCRCEEVTAGRVRNDVRTYGADDLRSLKLLSRVGMGLCQGRICGHATATILAAETGREPDLLPIVSRPIVTPVPLRTLAADQQQPT